MYAYPRVCFYSIGEVFDHDLPNEMKNPDEEFSKIKWISTWRRYLALVNHTPFSTTHFINTSPCLKRQWPLNFRIMLSVLQYKVRFFAFSKHNLANPQTRFCYDRVEILLLGHHIAKNILQHQQFVESLGELLEPIQIPSSVMTCAVIRSLVFLTFQTLIWLHWCLEPSDHHPDIEASHLQPVRQNNIKFD